MRSARGKNPRDSPSGPWGRGTRRKKKLLAYDLAWDVYEEHYLGQAPQTSMNDILEAPVDQFFYTADNVRLPAAPHTNTRLEGADFFEDNKSYETRLRNVAEINHLTTTISNSDAVARKYGVTNFNLLGSMPHFLLKQPERPNDRDNQVWRVNSAACPKELIEVFESRFDVKVYEAYGAVDGGGFMLLSYGRENIPVGTMGQPPDGVTAEIMDDDGTLLGPDDPGELVFRVKEEEREQRKVVYYKDEEASKSRIQEGPDGQLWFHTGDLATRDEDGWFYFVDRKKDAIRRRGENIAAWSIERVINHHGKVLESAAFGVKSAEYAEDEVMVAVVLKPGERMAPEELLDFCQDKMADFMIPRFIDFVEKLPKSEVHRIMKRFLKDQGVTETTYDREKAGYKIRKG